MARKSERLSGGMKAGSTHKRVASATVTPSGETKRAKKATPTKSQYFKGDNDDDAPDLPDESDEGNESDSAPDDASDFEDAGEKVASSEAEIENEEDDESEDEESEDEPKLRKKSGKGTSSSKTGSTKGKELWRPEVKAGPGVTIIKRPQARKAGKTPYSDDTIHPNTLLFLKDLKENNDRVWLKMHDADFRTSERDWFSFVEKITEKLTEIDDTVPELPVKDIIFRIYRDVRFSSDPTPYKPHFSAAWSRTGRKGPYAHYYVQIAPNDQSFVGCGCWSPEASATAAMRRDIDLNPSRIKAVLMEDRLRELFLDGVSKQEKKVVSAFVATNAANALKTKPKGYGADHADIDLLRLRNYTIKTKLTDNELLGAEGLDRIADLLTCMKPFVTYLNSVVMPDATSSAEEDESIPDGEDESNLEDDAES